MKTEVREFAVHKNILLSVMQAQAGSLSKALLEGVMNSIDAEATRIAITLDHSSFSIKDNGTGIQERQAILDYFETFGTPHEEGDAKLGVFRIGRGQLMSFAATIWRTGPFEMAVDIESGSIGYTLKEGLKPSKGCVIKGTLYEALDDSKLNEVSRDFKDLVKYSPVPVYLNGKLISKKPETQKWDYEDEFGYYKLNTSDDLFLYNLGMLVNKISSYRMGAGGIIVSKKQLKVNFARNDVLEHKCETWRHMRVVVESLSLARTINKPSLSKAERDFLARQWAYGRLPQDTKESFRRLKLFTDSTGKHVSLEELINATRISAATGSKTRLAARLQREGLALVLAPETLHRFYAEDLEELLENIQRASGIDLSFKGYSLEKLAEGFSDAYVRLEDDSIDSAARCMLMALRDKHEKFYKWFRSNEKVSGMRELSAGRSDAALAWTDGRSSIVLTEKELLAAANKGVVGCFGLLLTLTHEYCHDESDLETHDHDVVFMTKHHDLIQYHGTKLLKLAQELNSTYERLFKKAGGQAQSSTSSAKKPEPQRPDSPLEQLAAKVQLPLPL